MGSKCIPCPGPCHQHLDSAVSQRGFLLSNATILSITCKGEGRKQTKTNFLGALKLPPLLILPLSQSCSPPLSCSFLLLFPHIHEHPGSTLPGIGSRRMSVDWMNARNKELSTLMGCTLLSSVLSFGAVWSHRTGVRQAQHPVQLSLQNEVTCPFTSHIQLPVA